MSEPMRKRTPKLSIDNSISLSTYKQRNRFLKFLYNLPGYRHIRRILLLDAEIIEPDYLDESQELALVRKKSAADLFYPINMARMPIAQTALSTYFHDERKKIDYVLIFESDEDYDFDEPIETSQFASLERITLATLKYPDVVTFQRNNAHYKRESFLSYLRNAGVYIEKDIVTTQKRILHFVKLSVSWQMMTKFADALQLRVPLEIQPEITRNWSAVILQYFKIKNLFLQYIPEEPLNFYTAPFKRANLKSYLWSDQKETFFSATQRIHVVDEILQLCHYGRMRKTEVGIDRLLEQKAFIAAFPLHDGDWKSSSNNINNMRHILYQHWARWGRWYKYQPLNHIRAYFGEKIAYYFAFLGFYTSWLTMFALFGVIIFAIQTYQLFDNKIVNTICASGETYKMCPRCVSCQSWYLSDLCMYFKAAGIFDSIPMVVFSFFACLWANTFLANWKRNSVVLAYQWSCHEVVWEEHRPRANYIINAPFLRLNPVTGRTEPHFPHAQKNYRIALTTFTVLAMISIVIISMGLSITYRSILTYQGNAKGGPEFRRILTILGHIGSAIIQLILIAIFGHIYTKIAVVLTEWEMHRSETEYENNLIFKLFIFQFVNNFSPLFYSAFIKSKFITQPNESNSVLGLQMISEDYCEGNSCFLELTIQLCIYLIAKEGIWLLVHKIKRCWQKPKDEIYVETELQWEKDYGLEAPEGLLHNYLEIALQYSFVTLFVSAFPLAPLFALIKNCYEIRRYAQTLICKSRRPVPRQAKSIEVWYDILRTITILSAVSNGFIIAFTSDLIPRLLVNSNDTKQLHQFINDTFPITYTEGVADCRLHFHAYDVSINRYLFLIIYEHITLGITLVLQAFIPDIPKTLQLRLKREQFIARQSMAETATTLETPTDHPLMKTSLKQRKKRIWTAWEPKREFQPETPRRMSRVITKDSKSMTFSQAAKGSKFLSHKEVPKKGTPAKTRRESESIV